MKFEVFERCLRKICKFRRDVARLRIRMNRADELCVHSKTGSSQKQAILVSRLRLADVHETIKSSRKCWRADREGSDLCSVRTLGRCLGLKADLSVGAGGLAV